MDDVPLACTGPVAIRLGIESWNARNAMHTQNQNLRECRKGSVAVGEAG